MLKKIILPCVIALTASSYAMISKSAKLAKKASHARNYSQRIWISRTQNHTTTPLFNRTFKLAFPANPGSHHLEPISQQHELYEHVQKSRRLNQLLILHACSTTGVKMVDELYNNLDYNYRLTDLIPNEEVVGSIFFEPVLAASLLRILFQQKSFMPAELKISTENTFNGTIQLSSHTEFDYKKISQYHHEIAFIEVGITQENK